jgi:DNA-binding MarR family transcriptional regulator
MEEFTRTERLILIHLHILGAGSPSLIAEDLDRSRGYISQTLKELENLNLVRSRHGVWFPTHDGASYARAILRKSNEADMLEWSHLDDENP